MAACEIYQQVHDKLTPTCRASGLGKACVIDIISTGGYAAVLDFNEEAGAALIQELGPAVRFFQADVTSSESISAAVKATLEWVKETGSMCSSSNTFGPRLTL